MTSHDMRGIEKSILTPCLHINVLHASQEKPDMGAPNHQNPTGHDVPE